MNVSWVGQSQPYTFRESTPVHNPHLFGANTPVYPTFDPQQWSNALPEPPPITPRMDQYILYKGPPSSNTSKQDEGQKEYSEQDEGQKEAPKQDEGQKDISSSKIEIDDRMARLERKFEKMMETMKQANEAEFEELQPSPPPRRVVNTERSLAQTLSRCIGCNEEGHYLWDCPDSKEQQVDWDDLNFIGSGP